MSEKLNICIIFGGASSEHEVSCMSAASVINNIDKSKYNVYTLGITKEGRQYLYTGDVNNIENASFVNDTKNLIPAIISPCPLHHGIIKLNKEKCTYEMLHIDCIFPVVHGENCEDGNLQGLLKLSGIPYVGSDNRGSAVSMDKAVTKTILSRADIPMADFYLFRIEEELESGIDYCEKKFGYPIFVKPAGTGSSVGISKVHNRDEFRIGLAKAFRFDKKVIAEEFIEGKEIEVAVLDNIENGNTYLKISRPGEIDPGADFYDYDTKYINNTTKYYIPARINEEEEKRVRDLAGRIFRLLDCKGLSRVDFFVGKQGVIFNEINTLPGFTSISMYPKLMKESGIDYSSLITKLIEFALFEEEK